MNVRIKRYYQNITYRIIAYNHTPLQLEAPQSTIKLLWAFDTGEAYHLLSAIVRVYFFISNSVFYSLRVCTEHLEYALSTCSSSLFSMSCSTYKKTINI